jgi:hypothetical protein
MRKKPKLEAPLNAKAFHPPLERAYRRCRDEIASTFVKEHLINHQPTIAISTATALRTTCRITGALRA